MPGKRTPEEPWKGLQKEARDSEAAEAASKGASGVGKELVATGFDVDAERVEARALREGSDHAVASSRPPESLAQVRSMRPAPRRSAVPWIAAGAVFALVGGGWLYERLGPQESGDPTRTRAAVLRRQAFDACHASRWQECLARFDEAKAVDSDGDSVDGVQVERAKAVQALLGRPK